MDDILKGNVQVAPFVEERPMSIIAEAFDDFYHNGSPMKRIVLVPDFS